MQYRLSLCFCSTWTLLIDFGFDEFLVCFCLDFNIIWSWFCHKSSFFSSCYDVINLIRQQILRCFTVFRKYSRYCAVHVSLWHYLTKNSVMVMAMFSFLHVLSSPCLNLFIIIPLSNISLFFSEIHSSRSLFCIWFSNKYDGQSMSRYYVIKIWL